MPGVVQVGEATARRRFTVEGFAGEIDGNLSVTGDLDVGGETTVDDLVVGGLATVAETLDVTGETTVDDLVVEGAATVAETLDVTGATTVDDFTSTGAASIDAADLSLPNAPTEDPTTDDQIWAENDVLTVSSSGE